MTVGEFKRMFDTMPRDAMVTFGSSSFSRRPLMFERIKQWDDNAWLIELSEITADPQSQDYLIAQPEHQYRLTVADLMNRLDECGRHDDWTISFAATSDACDLELKAVVPAVAVDLVQTGPPQYYAHW